MPGHLFIVRSDIRQLAVDAWLLPVDLRLHLESGWTAGMDEDEPVVSAVRALRSLPPDALSEQVRVVGLYRAEGRASVYCGAVPVAGTTDSRWHVETVRQFAAVALRDTEGSVRHGRERPLLAVPALGTRAAGGWAVKGQVLRGLIEGVHQLLRVAAVDVVLACDDDATYAAAQLCRARLGEQDPDVWAELPLRLQDQSLELAKQARQRRVVPFLGAGVSRPAGLPDWGQLLAWLAEEAGMDERERSRLNQLTLLEQASVVSSRLDDRDADLGALLTRRLAAKEHPVGLALLGALPGAEAVTLNYDTLYEQASEAAGRPVAVLPHERVQDRWLLKMHGDIKRPEAGIVLTQQDYLRFARERTALAGVVQSLFITRELLFVGFGLSDPNFHSILYDVRQAAGGRRSETFGTALALRRDAVADLHARELTFVAMDDGGPATTPALARRLEIFLDHMLAHADTGEGFFLQESFRELRTEPEEELARLLEQLLAAAADNQDIRATSAWRAVVEPALKRLGAVATATAARASAIGVTAPPAVGADASLGYTQGDPTIRGKSALLAWLSTWLQESDDLRLGAADGRPGVRPALIVEVAGRRFVVNSDTKRDAVRRFVDLAGDDPDAVDWHIVANAKGRINRVLPGGEVIPGLYFYARPDLDQETVV